MTSASSATPHGFTVFSQDITSITGEILFIAAAVAAVLASIALAAWLDMRRRGAPTSVVIADKDRQPLVSISPLELGTLIGPSTRVPLSSELGGQLNAMMQGVPQLLVKKAHRGKRLMEVVIEGKMIRAADGDGLRAMAKDAAGKFKEHARLYDTKKLSTIVNVAAVWQIASVVVAQKHLADINEKLEELSKSVEQISRFLDDQRRAKITGTYSYLRQVAAVYAEGERPESMRIELERCERDLLEVQDHLLAEKRRKLAKNVEHKEWVGTQDLQADLLSKYRELQALSEDLQACLKTRALALYVLSLYPGESKTKEIRLASIQDASRQIKALEEGIHTEVSQELKGFDSWMNLASTLDERKRDIRRAATRAATKLGETRTTCVEDVASSQAKLIRHDVPIRFVVEMNDGKIQDVREVGLRAAACPNDRFRGDATH